MNPKSTLDTTDPRNGRRARRLGVLGGSLIAALVVVSTAAAGVNLAAGSDNRAGTIVAWSGASHAATVVGYSVNPENQYGEIDFNVCVNDGVPVACLFTNSQWLDFNKIGNSTTGFTIASTLTADGSDVDVATASEQINVSLIVSGLAGGETAALVFQGFIEDAGISGLGSVTITLVGPGVNLVRDTFGSWDDALNLANGEYDLEVSANANGSGGEEGVHYGVTFALDTSAPECGDAGAGSCFQSNGTPFCDTASCCNAVCAFDAFCCTTAWDALCVSGAFNACNPNVPLCVGRAKRFTGAQSGTVASFGSIAPTDAITIEFWQRLDSLTENTVVACQSSLENRIVTHTPWINGNIIFDFGAAFGGGRIEIPAPPDIASGWHHFAFVASASGQFMRVYYDGTQIGVINSASAFTQTSVPLIIADNFNGSIDELRIWNVARTGTQIAENYARTVPGNSAGLLAYYRMDSEAETTVLVDLAPLGGASIVTLTGAPASIADGPCVTDLCDDFALVFNGSDQLVNVGSMGSFGASVASSTVELWVKTAHSSERMSAIKIIDDRPGAGDPVLGIEFNRSLSGCVPTPFAEGHTLFFLRDNNLSVLSGVIDAPIYDGKWHHIAWRIVDSAANTMEVYVDGVIRPFIALCTQAPIAFTAWNDFLAIGAANNRGTVEDHFHGALDEVRLWSVARTPGQIQANWDREIAPTTAGLAGYWRFEEGVGSTTFDYAGSNDGTLVNAPVWSSLNPCEIAGDLNGDGSVDGADLGLLLSNWGGTGLGDLNGDGDVNGADLGILLTNWS